MHGMRGASTTEGRRLLSVLLVWFRALSAHPGGRNSDVPASLITRSLRQLRPQNALNAAAMRISPSASFSTSADVEPSECSTLTGPGVTFGPVASRPADGAFNSAHFEQITVTGKLIARWLHALSHPTPSSANEVYN